MPRRRTILRHQFRLESASEVGSASVVTTKRSAAAGDTEGAIELEPSSRGLKLKKINSSSGAFRWAARPSLAVAFAMAALFFALGLSQSFDAASAAGPQRRKAFLLGVVLPRHANPGSRISGRLVANPDDLAQDPRLIVEHVTLSIPADDVGRPILNDAFVDAGDGRQPASGRYTTRVPTDGSRIHVACGATDAPGPVSNLDVAVRPPSANAKASSHSY